MDRHEMPLYFLSGLALIGISVLTAIHEKVPDILNIIAGAALVGGSAITTPRQPPPNEGQ